MGWMKGRGLTEVACPACGLDAAAKFGRSFQDDNRMDDDLGIVEYYKCVRCGQDYNAYLRYATVEKAED